MLLTLIAFVVVFGLLVFVHELGHFLVAKRSGIVVDEFAFGYPPRLFKAWQEYGHIVLDGQAMLIDRKTRVARSIEVGKRVVCQTGPRADGQLAVTQIDPVPDDVPDDQVEAKYGQPARRVDELRRGTEYAINLIPFGGYVRMLGEEDPTAPGSFASKSKKVRMAVLLAGAGMNIVLAIVVFAATFVLGAPQPVASDNVMVMSVADNSPAAQAGLQMGDMILSLDGIAVKSPEELVNLTNQHLGQAVQLAVKRGEQTLQIQLTPRSNPPPNEGAIGVAIQAAVSKVDIVYYPFPQAVWLGIQQTFGTIGLTLSVPLLILRGVLPAAAVRPIGPYGIFEQTASAVQATVQLGWWYPLLSLVGLISTALAITNLLPLPALDGGRIFFILVEAVRGRRIDPAREGFVHFVGLAVLVALMLVISYFDVVRPITPIDWRSLF